MCGMEVLNWPEGRHRSYRRGIDRAERPIAQ
jgi:hypothetical protein